MFKCRNCFLEVESVAKCQHMFRVLGVSEFHSNITEGVGVGVGVCVLSQIQNSKQLFLG